MLRFSLKFKDSRTAKNFKRQLEMAGMSVESIPDEPMLFAGLDLYLDSFFLLSTTRLNVMGVGAISWLSTAQYAALNNLDEFSTYFLHRVVRLLDPIYMEHLNNESKKNSKR